MTIRTVTKALAGMEDLAAGVGSVVQQRGGTQVTVGKIDQAYAVLTEQDLADLNVELFTYARLDGFDYEYDADRTDGVPSNVGPGSWIIGEGGNQPGVDKKDTDRQLEITGLASITNITQQAVDAGLDLFPLIAKGVRLPGRLLLIVPSVVAAGTPLPDPAILDAVPTGPYATINGGTQVLLRPLEQEIEATDKINSLSLPVGGRTWTMKYYADGDVVNNLSYINRGQGWPQVADGYFNHADADGNYIELIYGSWVDLRHGGLKLDDDTQDAGDVLQKAFDLGIHESADKILPAGTFYWATTALAHKVRPKALGHGQTRTNIIPSTDLAFDTSRLPPEVSFPAEYATNALIVTTRVRTQDNNPNRGDEWIDIGGFTVDGEGTPAEQLANIVFSAGQSQGRLSRINHRFMHTAYFAKALSDGNSRHFYMDFIDLVGTSSVHQLATDWFFGLSSTLGTSWQINKCSGGSWQEEAYKLRGLLYTNVINSSYDNGQNGYYGWDLVNCPSVTFNGSAAESRLEGAGIGNKGGGLIRAIDSNVDINGSNWIGGDRDGVGSGLISDYDNGSGNVADGLILAKSVNGRARITFSNTVPEIRKDATNARLPVVATGSDASLHYLASGNDWVITDILCLSGAVATYIGKDGSFGVVTENDYYLTSSTSAIPENDSKLIAQGGDPQIDYDLFDLVSNGELFAGVAYRANFGALGLGDYTVINWPTVAGPFGVVMYVKAGIYQYLEVTVNAGAVYRSISTDNGATFGAWLQLV